MASLTAGVANLPVEPKWVLAASMAAAAIVPMITNTRTGKEVDPTGRLQKAKTVTIDERLGGLWRPPRPVRN